MTMRTILALIIGAFSLSADSQTTFGTVQAGAGGGASGTVTSVGISGASGMSVTGSPITTNGSITLAWTSQAAGLFLGSPCNSAGAPVFRNLCAADIPALDPSKITGVAIVDGDARLTDARTPTAHASTHASAGSDPVTLAQSQVTNLTPDLAGKQAADSDLTDLASSGSTGTGAFVRATGNVATATAFAANPADCSANQFATAIAASGNLTCAGIASGDLPATIAANTSGNAATATALAANPSDCSAGQFANAIAASGNLTCAPIAVVDLPTVERHELWMQPSNTGASSLTGVGIGAPTASGTNTAYVDASGLYLQNTSGSVSGTPSNIRLSGIAQTRMLPDATFVVRTGTDHTNVRIWIGLASGTSSFCTNVGASDDPSGCSALAFGWSSSESAFWRVYTNDGTTTGSRTATSVAMTTDTRYVLRIEVVSTSSVRFYINGTLVATQTTELPASSTDVGLYFEQTPLEAVAKTIRVAKFYMTSF